MDQRVITSPEGQSMLIPASERLSASAIALVEPWACVEDAYTGKERRCVKTDGQMLVVADTESESGTFSNFLERYGRPARITCVSKTKILTDLNITTVRAADISELEDGVFDDVIYFGSKAETVEAMFAKIAASGLFNVVLCGGSFGRAVATPVGRFHYGNIRMVGTAGFDPAESMRHIPASGEIRKGDKINVIGAAGPMGTMHVIRNICQRVEGVSVFAGDIDDNRLAALGRTVTPLAEKNNVGFNPYNPVKSATAVGFDYTVLMTPVPKLVADSVKTAADGGIINIFAGIPAEVTGQIDLDAYIEKHLYFIGTSGSTLDDMKTILAKVEADQLDTNLSVAAVCGLGSAAEAIKTVENHLIPGKIIVYPACKGLGLIKLKKIESLFPEVARALSNGLWNKKAEEALLETCRNSQTGTDKDE